MPPTSGRLTSEILDEQGMDPPTRQMSQLHIRDIAPPDPSPHKKMPGPPTQVTQQTPIPTWGQIKMLCHQARGIASLQGSSASPEKMFIAILALLSCQVSASPIPTKYWAYLPGPPTFQVVTWNNEPIRVNTDQPQLLGGLYTSYTKDKHPINFNYTIRRLTDELPVCFNFPTSKTGNFVTPTKEGCVGASKKVILTESLTQKPDFKGPWSILTLQAHMSGICDPFKSLFLEAPSEYPNCRKVTPSNAFWSDIDDHSGFPIWKSYT